MAMTPALLLSLLACSGEQPPSPPPAELAAPARPSLVLITLDTTRYDAIGANGNSNAITPNLDGLAAHGARFERAFATVPLTTPSHSSMLTGLYPPRHGVHTNGDAVLPDEVTTLAEALKANGYATAAAVSAFVTTRIWNLDQGFDAYFDHLNPERSRDNRWSQERPANKVVDDAIGWLATQPASQPFFLWLHFYDPHDPYRPPAEWAAKLPGRPYAGEVAFVDDQIGRLKATIDARVSPGGVAWMAIADHGEATHQEHGEFTHGLYLYNETTHVPFIVQPATPLDAPRVIKETTASGVDVMPTALGLLGLKPPEGLDGVDLSPAIRGEAQDRPWVYMESYTVAQRFGYHPELAIVDRDLKLMDTPNPQLFDLGSDFGETTNLAPVRAEDVARIGAHTDAVEAEARPRDHGEALAPEVVEQLAALGYIGAGNESTPETRSTIDAKDHMETVARLERARTLSQNPEKVKEAEEIYLDVLAKEPQISEARLGLATLYDHSGRWPEAEAVLREAIRLEPGSTVSHMNLGGLLVRMGRPEEGLLEMQAVLALVPTDESARGAVIRMLGKLGRVEEARTQAQQWMAETPENLNLKASLGVVLCQNDELVECERLLNESLADGVSRDRVQETLARLATARGDLDAAEQHLQAELMTFPSNLLTRRALAGVHMEQKRWEEGASDYQFLSEMFPQDYSLRRAWAQAIFNTGDYALAEQILKPAWEAEPNDPDTMLLRANIMAKIGDYQEAEALAKHAKELKALETRDQPRGGRRGQGKRPAQP